MAEVKLIKLDKTYKGGFRAVKSINLNIRDKEFLVLVGPSGCGKSTILRMIAGLENITGGELLIDEEVVNEFPPSERAIAMVFQNYALYPHMTAYENMAFGLKIKKVKKAEIHERVMHAAKILELEPLLKKKPGHMSGGQRQRVAIGRAIVRKPKVFLFDEPLSNLDAKLRGQMRIEIAKLHKKVDTTMVYVTHDQVEAMTLGNRIVVLKDGIIMQVDTPMNLYNDPANQFVGGFIGSPPMNFMEGNICNKNGALFFESDSKKLDFQADNLKLSELEKFTDKKVILGTRSENITLTKENKGQTATIDCEVIALELLGDEKLIHLQAGDQRITAKSSAALDVKADDNVKAYIHLDKSYFFDKKTGGRIR